MPEPIASQPVLRVQDVAVHFGGIVALDGVSFDVARGQIVGLIGPNGAGKTTLFNCLSRLYPCDRGDIVFDGASLLALPRHRISGLGIGRTFQNVALFRSMSVLDNVMLGGHSRSRSGFLTNALRLPRVRREEDAAEEKARSLIRMLGLGLVTDAPVSALPFGTRKRVELARALASEPRLLLLDEPMAGMNLEEKEDMSRFVIDVNEHYGTTIALIEHDMGVVMDLSDRVVVLDHGVKIADATPDEVKRDQNVIDAYLGVAH